MHLLGVISRSSFVISSFFVFTASLPAVRQQAGVGLIFSSLGKDGKLSLVAPALDSSQVTGLPRAAQYDRGSDNFHLKRQEQLRRELQVKIMYTCPHGGSFERFFSWEAVYTFSNAELAVQGLENIDRVSDVVANDSTQRFHARWYHSYCTEKIHESCVYHIRAFTTGRVKWDGISMYLTTSSTKEDEQLKITESCEVHGAHPAQTCPVDAYSTGTHNCMVDQIRIVKIE